MPGVAHIHLRADLSPDPLELLPAFLTCHVQDGEGSLLAPITATQTAVPQHLPFFSTPPAQRVRCKEEHPLCPHSTAFSEAAPSSTEIADIPECAQTRFTRALRESIAQGALLRRKGRLPCLSQFAKSAQAAKPSVFS
jgi:hypothetical protein